MEKLFILRHADYNLDGSLSEKGKLETKQISGLIKKDIDDKSVCILSSIAKRAIESSNLIAGELKIDKKHVFKINFLFSESHHCSKEESEQIYQTIKKYLDKYKTIIIITHFQIVNGLFTYFLSEISDEKIILDKPKTSEGYFINFNNKDWKNVQNA